MLINGVPTSPWLYPEEKAAIVRKLYEYGLLKFDNERNLPLKSGGTTDVYINLRDARNTPEAITFLAELFAIPLRRLGISRFVEVPDSVSCFAGPLAVLTGLPYLTIREQGKEGRVADAKVIGNSQKGEKVAMVDDVITDGGSKIIPHQKCLELGLLDIALIVLVDRQQGWRRHLREAGIDLPVWAGMTLHDVRRHLIQTLGVMQRCKPEVEQANPIIVALDGKEWGDILPLIDRLRTMGCILKVNDLLFGQGIERLLPDLSVYGRVMADLKCHDIPQTVENTCRRLHQYPPWAVTVHASGGAEMVKAARRGLAGCHTRILAVTVLTSIDPQTCKEIYVRQPLSEVKKLARIAMGSGADGLVCSPEEVAALRSVYAGCILVTPGIRSVGQDAGDQKRIATPKVARDNGANHLVMGRQILEADDPVAEVQRVLSDELNIRL
jgi:orotidine-5'-phosphate decarboxylase